MNDSHRQFADLGYGARVVAVVAILFGVVTFFGFSFVVPPRFEAVATIVLDSALIVGPKNAKEIESRQNAFSLNSNAAILRTAYFRRRVAKNLVAAGYDTSDIGTLAAMLEGVVRVRSSSQDGLIYVSAIVHDPVQAAKIANAFAEVYLKSLRNLAEAERTDRLAALSRQMAVSRKYLSSVSHELESYDALASKYSDAAIAGLNVRLASLRKRASEVAQAGFARTGAKDSGGVSDKSAALEIAMQRVRSEVERKVQAKIERKNLEREESLYRARYESALVTYQALEVMEPKSFVASRILNDAVPPSEATWPRPYHIALIAGLIGALASFLYYFLTIFCSRGFLRARELARYSGLPVFCVTGGEQFRWRNPLAKLRGRRRMAASLIARVANSFPAPGSRIASPALISSCFSDEGSRDLVSDLAEHFRGVGANVAVVELVQADRTSELCGASYGEETGEKSDFLVTLGRGSLGVDPGSELSVLLDRLVRCNDVVLVRAPAVFESPELCQVAHLLDRIIFTVNWNKTSATQLSEGLDCMNRGGCPVSDLVLTNIPWRALRHFEFGGGKATDRIVAGFRQFPDSASRADCA